MAYWKDRLMSFRFEMTERLQSVRDVADLVLPVDVGSVEKIEQIPLAAAVEETVGDEAVTPLWRFSFSKKNL